MNKFAKWLTENMTEADINVHQLADELCMAYSTIYRHINGTSIPKFPYVVAYCWYFSEFFCKKIDPLDIYYNYVERR